MLGWATAPFDLFGPSSGEEAHGIAIDQDGTIILAGEHTPAGPEPRRFAALQLMPIGTGITLGWATAISGPFGSSLQDQANGVAIGSDGNIVLGGFHVPDPMIAIQFAALQLIPNMSGGVGLGWATAISQPFGTAVTDGALAVAIDLSGATVLAGAHDIVGATQFAALQLVPNLSGSVDLGWATAISGPFGPFLQDQANGIAIDPNGSSVLAGVHKPVGGASQFAALQLIPSGPNQIVLGWAMALVEPFGPSDGDSASDVVIATDGTIILAGEHSPSGPEPSRFAALQLIPNLSGGVDLGWVTAPLNPFGPSESDQADGVAIASDGTIILAGNHNPAGPEGFRFAALQLIPSGLSGITLGWATAIGEPFGPSSSDLANGIAIDSNGNPILAGKHDSVSLPSRFAALQLVQRIVPLPISKILQLPFVPCAAA